jgi:hypothetical protein
MPDSSFHFGGLVSEFVHAAIQGLPIFPLGQEVSPFIDGLHDGVSSFSIDAMGWML